MTDTITFPGAYPGVRTGDRIVIGERPAVVTAVRGAQCAIAWRDAWHWRFAWRLQDWWRAIRRRITPEPEDA